MVKFCIICGKELLTSQTKLCSDKECHRKRINEYSHEYRQNNPEKIKNYYQNNQEKFKESSHEHYQNNAEKICERIRKKYRYNRGLSGDIDLYKESSIEIITREWLQENNINFIAQYYINLENSTWTHVDFFIQPNICLYCDGNYYHSLSNVEKCDENQNRILPQMGYNVIRLSEIEILEGNKVWCKLAQYLSKYGIDIK